MYIYIYIIKLIEQLNEMYAYGVSQYCIQNVSENIL